MFHEQVSEGWDPAAVGSRAGNGMTRLTCEGNYPLPQRRRSQIQLCVPSAGLIGRQTDTGLFEHEPCRNAGIGVVVFVAVIDDLRDAGLDDGLGTFVAREESHIDACAFQVVVRAVEDGVQLGVADVHVFGLQRFALPFPWHRVVVAADGHTVVA